MQNCKFKSNYKYMKKIKERIKELRLDKKLSQKELSMELGLSEKTISHYESGYSEPNLDMLIKLSVYFKVSTDYLLGLED